MAAASSSGTNQRLTLDHQSFERLLAAAWVLQCLHDQLHPPVDGGKGVGPSVTLLKGIGAASSGRLKIIKPEIITPAIQPLPMVIEPASKPVALSARPAGEETLTELVKAHEVFETGILKLDATLKRWNSLSPQLTHKAARHESASAQSIAQVTLIRPSPLGHKPPDHNQPAPHTGEFNFETRLNRLRVALARRGASFRVNSTLRALRSLAIAGGVNLRTTLSRLPDTVGRYQAALRFRGKELAWHRFSFNLEAALGRLRDACTRRTSTFRIRFTLRSLRAVAIATPVWLLVMVANLLLLETWLHQPFQGARAMSVPSPSTAHAAMSVDPPLPSAHSAQRLSLSAKRVESPELRQRTPIPPFAASHDQITDPPTASAVAQLSRFEIRGLRRQAKFGDDSAVFTLGMVYEVGRYVHQNCAEAARWVTMAAQDGNPAAEYNLGLRYRDGDGVPADLHESEKWLRKAAAHRNHNAKLALQLLASR
ncbi:MAG: tetratricopeptide repeat protein [Terriglobales bacterium]